MDQKWIQVLVILLFCQKFISAGNIIGKEGGDVPLKCEPKEANTFIWFRVVNESNMEFIASLSSIGFVKKSADNFKTLFRETNSGNTLTLRSFDKNRDSGIYSCASIVKGNELNFGEVTRLAGETKPTPPPRHTTTPTSTTTKSCPGQVKPGSSMFCSPLILGSLAGGCGLLLLLLIVTILHCNKIRTRRCPHHYKRRPKIDALEKQMTNRHI